MEKQSPLVYTATVRRNPPRKARPTTAKKGDQQVSDPPPKVSSFPTDEILAMEVPKSGCSSDPTSEKLRVFLRIRPIVISSSPSKDHILKSRVKNAWPQDPAKKNSTRVKSTKKKIGDVCVTVNDSKSVTLSPPLALQESKRIKSEVYEGFSHVFAPDSSQEYVFENMVSPLVDDFLRGKSGMVAALGPSGSGKTHTVFGSPRDPGIVPRTLQRIFERTADTGSESHRSFSLSIFEISSERGKGEKLFDLCPDGAEITMQHSSLKGLQEVMICDAKEAESLVARAMLRRLTATTNSNSQSSRSQCIINIHSVAKNPNGEDDFSANKAMLSIIDLAGAEKEKRTGNQGARLLESNFINNTSMVFGLCLRSLLEHQKNPKKPLQKHFQSSLLTRYLRDYLEGKKRMTLILTVKPGEEDYLDTTYLLRQASPLMSIRFNNVEEKAIISCNKRQPQALPRREKPKKMRLSDSKINAIEEKKASEDEHSAPVEGCLKENTKSDSSDTASLNCINVELATSERSYRILQNFSKALWTVLKQHGDRLKVAESEIRHLTENLMLEKTRNMELEKELENLKSQCTCSQQKSVEVGLAESDINSDKSSVDLCSLKLSLLDCNVTPANNGSTPRLDRILSSQVISLADEVVDDSPIRVERSQQKYQAKDEACPSALQVLECIDNIQVKEEASSNEPKFDTPLTSVDDDVLDGVEISQQKNQIHENLCGNDHRAEALSHDSRCSQTDEICTATDVADEILDLSEPIAVRRDDSGFSRELNDQQLPNPLKPGNSDVVTSKEHNDVDIVDKSESRIKKEKKKPSNQSTSAKENIVSDDRKATNTLTSHQRDDTPSNSQKPKRRLLPASTALLKNFSTLEIVDKNEKPRGNKGEERNRTQGSLSLLRLLDTNIHR